MKWDWRFIFFPPFSYPLSASCANSPSYPFYLLRPPPQKSPSLSPPHFCSVIVFFRVSFSLTKDRYYQACLPLPPLIPSSFPTSLSRNFDAPLTMAPGPSFPPRPPPTTFCLAPFPAIALVPTNSAFSVVSSYHRCLMFSVPAYTSCIGLPLVFFFPPTTPAR